jgi:MFS family permease
MAITFPFVIVFTGDMFQYYKILLGDKAATELSSAYSIIFASIGSIGSPLIGALSDRIGMKYVFFST